MLRLMRQVNHQSHAGRIEDKSEDKGQRVRMPDVQPGEKEDAKIGRENEIEESPIITRFCFPQEFINLGVSLSGRACLHGQLCLQMQAKKDSLSLSVSVRHWY